LLFLNYVEFKGDEGQDATIVRTMLETGVLAQTGIVNSIGTLNFPISLYLMSIPLAFSPDPRLATAFVGVLNVAAVGVAWVLGSRLWGAVGATVTGLLFALSPWAVVASRKLWPPWFIPLFATCCLACVMIKRRGGSGWWVSGALVCWLWASQLHPTVLFEAPVFLLAGRLFWRKVHLYHVGVGVVIGLLPSVPYIVFDAGHGWMNLTGYVKSAGMSAATDSNALRLALLNLTAYQTLRLGDVPYTEFTPFGNAFYQASTIVTVMAGVVLVAMITACFFGFRRGTSAAEHLRTGDLLVLLGWLCLPVLLTVRHGAPLYQHYYVVLFPAAFLLCGGAAAAASGLGERSTPGTGAFEPQEMPGGSSSDVGRLVCVVTDRLGTARWRLLATFTSLAFVLVVWALLLSSYFAYLPSPRSVTTIGLPLDTGRDLGSLAAGAGRVGHLWYVADEHVLPMLGYMTHGIPDRQELPPDALVLPPPGTEAGYFFGDDSLPPARALLTAGADVVGKASYLGGRRTALAAIWTQKMDASTLGASLTPLPVRLANGVRFLGTGVERQSAGIVHITILWHVDRTDLGVHQDDLALYVHLVGMGGRTRAQHDGMPFASVRWTAGQTIETWFDLSLGDVPPGEYELRSGMYRRPSIERIAAIDASGVERDGEFSLGKVVAP